jgi:hypothetical protein
MMMVCNLICSEPYISHLYYVVSSVLYREELPRERNDAREIMATLPISRLEDLARDVWCELIERFPNFTEDVRV